MCTQCIQYAYVSVPIKLWIKKLIVYFLNWFILAKLLDYCVSSLFAILTCSPLLCVQGFPLSWRETSQEKEEKKISHDLFHLVCSDGGKMSSNGFKYVKKSVKTDLLWFIILLSDYKLVSFTLFSVGFQCVQLN